MRASMPVPLTHHRIMSLIAPFAKRGRHVDLAATDRLAGRLCFQVVERGTGVEGESVCREHLVLETSVDEHLRLIRRLESDSGLSASLEIEGIDPETLIAALDRQPGAGGFAAGDDWLIAWRHKLPRMGSNVDSTASPQLLEAHARVAGTRLHLRMSSLSGVPADILLELEETDTLRLPDDFFAVLGWHWGTRLRRTALGWTTTLLVRGRGAERHQHAMQQFERAVRHLALTVSEASARFHHRCVRARWLVAARRSIPLTFSLALLILTLQLPRMHIAADSSLRMLIFNAPPLLLVLAFSLRELPRIELPRRPRPSGLSHWRTPAA